MAWYLWMDSHHRSTGYESVALLLSYIGILAFLLCSNEEGSGGRITSQHQELIVLIRSPVIKPAGGLCALTGSNRRRLACKASLLPAEVSAHIAPPHPAYDGARIGFRSRAGVDRCLPLSTHRCLLLPTSWRKWFSFFLVSAETSRYLVCQVENCTLQYQCRLTDTDLCAGSLPTWILTHMVDLTGTAPVSML